MKHLILGRWIPYLICLSCRNVVDNYGFVFQSEMKLWYQWESLADAARQHIVRVVSDTSNFQEVNIDASQGWELSQAAQACLKTKLGF